jgi:hypothetical protein
MRHIITPQLSQVTSLGLSNPSATSLTSSHLSHLNSYIGINEPLKRCIAIPVTFFNALLSIGYFTDTALGGLHLVIAALVASVNLILSTNYSVNWIK